MLYMPTPLENVDAGMSVLLGETLTYGALNREIGSPFKHGGNFPGQICRLCDDINARHDATTGLPFMISALAHNGDTHLPGPGFFQLAANLGKLPSTDDDLKRRVFVSEQLQAIYSHYRAEDVTQSG